MTRFLLTPLLLAASLPGARAGGEKFFLRGGERVVFLGDSITHAGLYIHYVEAYLLTRFPDRKFELINLGLPSETVSGLSEPDHPYPRPDVHERLDRVLAKTKPDVVVACYGMNDGIYYPFGESRFDKYQAGIRRLVRQARRAGARVVLLTPAAFDPVPIQDKVRPGSAKKFSWMAPYARYDDVLGRYARWLLTLRGKGIPVADVHAAMDHCLADARRSDPSYHFAGDGIHPDATGHGVIARELLRLWHAPAQADAAALDLRARQVLRGHVTDLTEKQGVIRFRWRSRLPLPADPRWDRRLAERERISDRLNRYRLTVRGAGRDKYQLAEGDKPLGQVARSRLEAGLDLTRFTELSTNRRSAEVLRLVQKSHALLDPAWLTAVGHKRPDMPKALPLDEARRRAAPLQRRARELAQPVTITLRLSPAGG